MPSVGVAGFTLGSGSGWLERKLGLAADSLRSAHVVTAGGELVTASAEEHPDLFWALRGGGPSFGVVVELELALHPVGPDVTAGLIGWPIDRAGDVAAAYAELMAGAPDELGGAVALLAALPAPFIPERLHGEPIVAVVVSWTGDAAEGDALLAPLRALGPAFDAVRPMPYAVLQGLFESPERFTARVRGEGGFLTELTPELVAVLADLHARKPAPMGSLLVQPLGGAFARVAPDTTPLGRRAAPWALQAGAAWHDPDRDGAVEAWADELRAALAPWWGGESWPNFIPRRTRSGCGPPTATPRGRACRRSAPAGIPTACSARATRSRCRRAERAAEPGHKARSSSGTESISMRSGPRPALPSCSRPRSEPQLRQHVRCYSQPVATATAAQSSARRAGRNRVIRSTRSAFGHGQEVVEAQDAVGGQAVLGPEPDLGGDVADRPRCRRYQHGVEDRDGRRPGEDAAGAPPEVRQLVPPTSPRVARLVPRLGRDRRARRPSRTEVLRRRDPGVAVDDRRIDGRGRVLGQVALDRLADQVGARAPRGRRARVESERPGHR